MDVSIIIRFKNEERFLGDVLNAVLKQKFPEGSFDILAVDNCSTDNSRKIVEKYGVNVIEIDDYRPGFALNSAIKYTRGRHIAVLSAHTIPANDRWLGTLYGHMEQKRLLGVYGAQLYPSNSKFLSKCVLDRFSTLEPRKETKDSDFWNANSMFSRAIWKQQPFNEDVFELEDHYWTKQLLHKDLFVRFEPSALVYHYGHIERLDRQYLPIEESTDETRIQKAMRDLENCGTDWPVAMCAGLTLSSVGNSTYLKEAVDIVGKVLISHADFDLRWRLAYVLGKIPISRSAEYLADGLTDPSLYPKDAVAWSLGKLGKLAIDPILKRMDGFTEFEFPFAALALGLTGEDQAEKIAVELLVSGMRSNFTILRMNALYSAGELANFLIDCRIIKELSKQIHSTQTDVLRAACWALGCYLDHYWPWQVRKKMHKLAVSNLDPLIRFEATIAIGKQALVEGSQYWVDFLIEQLSDPHPRVRYGAAQSLRLISKKKCIRFSTLDCRQLSEKDFGCEYEIRLMEE